MLPRLAVDDAEVVLRVRDRHVVRREHRALDSQRLLVAFVLCAFVRLLMHNCVYVYIYIYIYIERERHINIYRDIYREREMYLSIYIYIYVCREREMCLYTIYVVI